VRKSLSRLACIPLEDGAASSAEKEQLKLELQLISKEISVRTTFPVLVSVCKKNFHFLDAGQTYGRRIFIESVGEREYEYRRITTTTAATTDRIILFE
jgi:hypothetical protein